MEKLVIIGNGFDVAHGLNTRYSNFMEYLQSYEKVPEYATERFIWLHSVSESDQAKHNFYKALCKYIPEDDLWSCFEYALCEIDSKDVESENSNYLIVYGDDNWTDSAHHDYQYMIEEDLSFAHNIPKYFHEWISREVTAVSRIISTKIINPKSIFLNFNYTDTLEKTYNIPAERILYVHGNAVRGDKLILGHHDKSLFQSEPEPIFNTEEERDMYYENLIDDVRIIEAQEIIKSYYKATYKDTASIIKYNYNFFNTLTDIKEIFILGHSLSDIDYDYFNIVAQKVSTDCKWYISYYNDDDYNNALNLIRILEVINYTLITLGEIQ